MTEEKQEPNDHANDEITKLKAEIFDIMRAQEKLKTQYSRLEQAKGQKMQELTTIEATASPTTSPQQAA